MAEKVPGWLERILLPQIGEIKGELRAVNGRMDGLEAKMDAGFLAVNTKIQGLEDRMDGELGSVRSEIKRLDERMAGFQEKIVLGERLATVESRVSALEMRKA